MTNNIDRAAKQDMTEPDFIKKHPVPLPRESRSGSHEQHWREAADE